MSFDVLSQHSSLAIIVHLWPHPLKGRRDHWKFNVRDFCVQVLQQILEIGVLISALINQGVA